MIGVIQGSAMKYGDNINTDIISPPQYMELGISEAARHAMEAVDPKFAEKSGPDKIFVAGKNLGSGSSRETSPLALKYLGIRVIVAEFFARIFYRNAINVGLLLLECPSASEINEGDKLEIDAAQGRIKNITAGRTYPCSRIPDHIMELIEDGGLAVHLKKSLE